MRFSTIHVGLLLVALFLSALGRGKACSCNPEHRQTKFCRADFVAVIEVKEIVEDDLENLYKVKVKNIFKDAMNILKGDSETSECVVKLWTPSSRGRCGVDLKLHEIYVVSGRIISGKLQVSNCDIVKPWGRLNIDQKEAFANLYNLGCSCNIVNTLPYLKEEKLHCILESQQESRICQREYAVCIMQPKLGCSWSLLDSYKRCLERHQSQPSTNQSIIPTHVNDLIHQISTTIELRINDQLYSHLHYHLFNQMYIDLKKIVCDKLSYNLYSQIFYQMYNSSYYQVLHQLHDQLYIQHKDLCNQLNRQLWNSTFDKVYYQLGKNHYNSLNVRLEKELYHKLSCNCVIQTTKLPITTPKLPSVQCSIVERKIQEESTKFYNIQLHSFVYRRMDKDLYDELKNQLCSKLNPQLYNGTFKQLYHIMYNNQHNQVRDQFRDEIHLRVKNLQCYESCFELNRNVFNQTFDKVYYKLGEDNYNTIYVKLYDDLYKKLSHDCIPIVTSTEASVAVYYPIQPINSILYCELEKRLTYHLEKSLNIGLYGELCHQLCNRMNYAFFHEQFQKLYPRWYDERILELKQNLYDELYHKLGHQCNQRVFKQSFDGMYRELDRKIYGRLEAKLCQTLFDKVTFYCTSTLNSSFGLTNKYH